MLVKVVASKRLAATAARRVLRATKRDCAIASHSAGELFRSEWTLTQVKNSTKRLYHTSRFTRFEDDSLPMRRRPEPGVSVGANLIPMINKLQDIFAMVGTEIDLPQLVVIGAQSSGKSSVLENLVGRDFLPRGSGIVTRRPLILQLNRVDAGSEEYAEFLHKPGFHFTNFDQVRQEIDAETERKAGHNKGVSNEPIVLKIYSPNVLNLTLVDTPGITRIPVGDQPANIEQQIRDMINIYIAKPNAIILAVTAANQDLSTSDALKLAREVDPDGSRTIGVLTKLDLMDKGTDAAPILLGRHLPLQHGWIGLVNRSQQDINNKKPIRMALSSEVEYFNHHPNYKSLTDRTGTAVLADRCSKLLSEHIKKTLPKLRSQISDLIKKRRAELEAYGEPIVMDSTAAKGWQLIQILNTFSQDFRSAIEGSNPDFDTKELNGGARIRYIFSESFAKSLNEIKATTGLSTNDIRTAIRNAAGPKPALFVPEKAFEQLVKKQIELLRDPALQCVEQVHAELLRIVAALETQDMARFRHLRTKIVDVATSVLKRCMKDTNRMVDTLIKLELSWINTSHPDFTAVNILMQGQSGGSGSNSAAAERLRLQQEEQQKQDESSSGGGLLSSLLFGSRKSEPTPAPQPTKSTSANRWNEPPQSIRIDDTQITERERQQVALIKSVLDSYFNIVKKSLQDYVVKVVMLSLVNSFKENLQKELVAQLYKEDLYNDLLYENEDVSVKRRVARQELEALQKAKKVIQMSEVFDQWD